MARYVFAPSGCVVESDAELRPPLYEPLGASASGARAKAPRKAAKAPTRRAPAKRGTPKKSAARGE